MGDLLTVVNDAGRGFNVRLVKQGDRFGLDDKLVHDKPDPMLEFYDATYQGDPRFGERGQFVARYYLSTLNDRLWGGALALNESVPVWVVSAFNVEHALAWANKQLARSG